MDWFIYDNGLRHERVSVDASRLRQSIETSVTN